MSKALSKKTFTVIRSVLKVKISRLQKEKHVIAGTNGSAIMRDYKLYIF